MTEYERGFTDGEREAFDDSSVGFRKQRHPRIVLNEYDDGWWDGYLPRSVQWMTSKSPKQRGAP